MIHIDGVSLPQRAWFRNSQSFSCGTYTFFTMCVGQESDTFGEMTHMHRVPTVYAKFREPISIFCDALPSFYLINKHTVEIHRH